jgi:bifunctional aspartokinase / homoserine dehydrogenase 1
MKKASTTKLRALRIMKFGGTSVGDAACIRRVAEIVRAAACDSDLVVVVSAMGGVTNQLLEAAACWEAGDRDAGAAIFAKIRDRHDVTVNSLLSSPEQRSAVLRKMEDCYAEGERLYRGSETRRELSLRERDSISSLGERLSAPLVAAALAECGLKSQALEATELIVTDSCHGAADPCMDATRHRCAICLRKLLQRRTVPVVTGFIGATPDGVLTTLGRGGSDYSATILGAALEADEVIIWTDVDGLMTADPKFVDGARTIPEISYQEAAELAHFGAKVLHPKTLHALARCGIPVWIRNTFAPERHGTRITPAGPAAIGGVRGLTAMLCCNLAQNSVQEKAEEGMLDPTASTVTAVGKNLRDSAVATRMVGALTLAQVEVVSVSEASSDCSISVVIAGKDKMAALVALHREFQLDAPVWLSASSPTVEPSAYYQSEQSPANGD